MEALTTRDLLPASERPWPGQRLPAGQACDGSGGLSQARYHRHLQRTVGSRVLSRAKGRSSASAWPGVALSESAVRSP